MAQNALGFLRWLWLSGEGWALRIALGLSVFVALALWDLARKGRQATRWKEYAFLFAATGVVMLYGLINDMVTVTISPLYFLDHERLALDTPHVRNIAAALALKVTWSPGLIFGVALLIANNPSKSRPQLPYRRMWPKLIYPLLPMAALAFILGLMSWWGLFNPWLEAIELCGPRSLKCVFCAHIGASVGGFLGGVIAVAAVVLEREKAARSERA